MDYNEAVELLVACEIPVPPDGAVPSAEQLAEKICNDGFIQTLAQRLMFETFAVAAVRAATGPQRAILRKRMGVGGVVAAPEPTRSITWHVTVPQSGNALVAIVGRVLNGSTVAEEVRFQGTPEAARQLTWKGTRPGPEVVEEYARVYKPGSLLGAEYHLAANAQRKSEPPTIGLPGDPRFQG